MVDIVSKFCIEVTQRIIRQRRKMDDRIETIEIFLLQIADVFADFRNLGCRLPELAAGKKVRVKPDHFVGQRNTKSAPPRRRYSLYGQSKVSSCYSAYSLILTGKNIF